MKHRRGEARVVALALAAAAFACSSAPTLIDPSNPEYATGSHAQEEFQPLRAKWEHGDRQSRIDLAPALRRYMKVHTNDPTARAAQAMVALLAAITDSYVEAHTLAAPLIKGDPGVTRDMALVAEGTSLRREGQAEAALKLLEPLFGKLLDSFARDVLNEELSDAAVDAGARDPKRYGDAVRYIRGWVAQTSSDDRDEVLRKIALLLDKVPVDPLVALVAELKGSDELSTPLLHLIGERLSSVALQLKDVALAKFLVTDARPLLGDRFDDIARIAALDAGVRLETKTIGLLLSLRTDEHKRRGIEISKGLAFALGLPGSEARVVSRDDQGATRNIDEALALLNADGAAVIIAGTDQTEADRAKAYGEKTGVPVLLLRPPSTPPSAGSPVFVLGEAPGDVDVALLQAASAKGLDRAAIIEGMRGEADVPLNVASTAVVGVHTCGSSTDFVGAQKAKAVVLDAGPICAREAIKTVGGGFFIGAGLDVPHDVAANVRAHAGFFPVDTSAPGTDKDVAQFALEDGAPSWWVGLGHDAGLIAWSAVKELPATRVSDAEGLAARKNLVTQRLGDAVGTLWTTEANGFHGARTMPRAITVK